MSFFNKLQPSAPSRASVLTINDQDMDKLTLESISNESNSGKNFWNIKGYKSALKRCDDGYKVSEKLKECVIELAEVEDAYAKALNKWEKKWLVYLNSSESSEYHSGKDTWVALLKVGSDLGDVHSEISNKLQRTPVDSIKKWLEENYKKNILHFKKTKEFEKLFQESQKTWQSCIEKVKVARDDYFASIKRLREIETNFKLKYTGPECNTVMKREAESKLDGAKTEKERSSKRYKDELEKLKLYEPTYRREMEKAFNEAQLFEETRLKVFKEIYSNCLGIFVEELKNEKIDKIFTLFSNQIENYNFENDLKWWSNNYGAGMQLLLPEFEEPF